MQKSAHAIPTETSVKMSGSVGGPPLTLVPHHCHTPSLIRIDPSESAPGMERLKPRYRFKPVARWLTNQRKDTRGEEGYLVVEHETYALGPHAERAALWKA